MLEHATLPARNYGLAELLLYSAAVALVLALLGELSYGPRGYNIEHFLGWTDPGAIGKMRDYWDEHLGPLGFAWVPRAYLAIDTAVFMPLYGLLLLGTGHVFADIFIEHARVRGRVPWLLLRTQLPALIVLLLLVDGLENGAGLARLGLPYLAPLMIGAAFALGWILCRQSTRVFTSAAAGRRRLLGDLRSDAAVIALEVIVFASVSMAIMRTLAPARCGADWLAVGCQAHALKQALIVIVSLDLLVLGVWPLLLPHANASQWAAAVAFRRAIRDVVFRSRYVLVAIAVVVLLLLVMNQGRDVIYAIAASPWDGPTLTWSLRALANSAVAMLLTSTSLWTFGYACWLWARLNGMTRSASAVARNYTDLRVEWFARDWARGVGIAPLVIAILMCLAAVRDAMAVSQGGPIWGLVVFVVVLVGGGIVFVWNRTRDDTPRTVRSGYYDSLPINKVLKIEHYTLFGLIKPLPLAGCALTAGLLCRALQVLSVDWQLGLPSLALPVFVFEMTFWLSLAGWLSLYEQSESVPLGIAVIILIGVLGLFGMTDNHVVAGALGVQPATHALAAHWMVCLAGLLALLVWATSYWLMLALRDGKAGHGLRAAGLPLLFLLLGGWGILALGDRLSRDLTLPPITPNITPRVTLPVAMAKWLASILPPLAADEPAVAGPPIPVYFIAAEGGGIRSAYWTASILARLYRVDEKIAAHTFAYSGVSGGSVGVAVYRGCSLERTEPSHNARADALDQCVAQFGRSDLLTPLLGAWFFEDGLARFLPQHCRHPGCGFLSRGLWFERALEEGTPSLRNGLVASRAGLVSPPAPHVPYLLLNSTWVETGERTIASELAIDWQYFPAARDQLDYLGVPDLRLATAAHNSARFPFTNALGAVRIPPARCTPPPLTAASTAPAANDEPLEICGHLADGGYFDNSGARTLSDVLRVFSRCLGGDKAACPGLDRAQLARLRPQVLLIRNGVKRGADQRAVCTEPAQPHAADIADDPRDNLSQLIGRPQCAGTVRLFADTLGPLITALNDTGIGANGRVAATTPGMMSIPLVAGRRADVKLIDLYDDGPLFPLGWHLSSAARAEMDKRSKAKADALFGTSK